MARNTNSCNYDHVYIENMVKNEMYIAWYIVAPIHYILGTPGHLLLFLAFYKQYKEESAYMYQVFATISEFLELQFWILLVLTVHFLSGSEDIEGNHIGVEWYQKSYFCMWYAAHLAHTNFSSFFTCSLLLSVAMTADRVYALSYPFKYKNINQRKHQISALVACVAISAATGFVDGLRYSVAIDGNRYKIVAEEADVSNLITEFLGQLRNVVRILALIALVGLNLILVRQYQKKFRQVQNISANDHEKEKKRKAQERILLMLTVCQSAFQALSVLSSVIYFSSMYASPYFAMCLWNIYGPIMDIIIEISDLLELYCTFAINKQFRSMLLNIFPCLKKPGNAVVVEAINSQSVRQQS